MPSDSDVNCHDSSTVKTQLRHRLGESTQRKQNIFISNACQCLPTVMLIVMTLTIPYLKTVAVKVTNRTVPSLRHSELCFCSSPNAF